MIRALSGEQKECLSYWLIDMPAEKLRESVNFLQDNLSAETKKLLPYQYDNFDSK